MKNAIKKFTFLAAAALLCLAVSWPLFASAIAAGGKEAEPLLSYEQQITVRGADGLPQQATVTVEAADGVFPQGAALSVTELPEGDWAQVDAAVDEERAAGATVAASYTFDVKMVDAAGLELQPAGAEQVYVSFSLGEVADGNLDTQVYHILEQDDELTAQPLAVETEADTATVASDGFSYYTVEFTYNDLTYVMPGDGTVPLADVLSYVGLSGEVLAASVSDPSLFSVDVAEGQWVVTAHRAFDTTEWLSVNIDGVIYEITVTDEYTDPSTGNDLSDRVIQDGDIDHFTQSMPLATIFIDEDILNIDLYQTAEHNDKITFEKLIDSGKSFYNDFFFSTTEYGRFEYKGKLQSNQDNYFPGNIAKYKITDAAEYTDQNGDIQKADIIITYSDLHLVIENGTGPYTPPSGSEIRLWDTNRVYPAVDAGAPSRLGLKVNANVKIVDKNGDLVDGTFIYPVIDVDVDRSTLNSFSTLYDAANNRNYSEQTELISGYEGKIWIPTTFKEGVTIKTVEEQDGTTSEHLLVYPRASDFNTFDGGFITLAHNAGGGITTALTAGAAKDNYNTGVESYLLGGPANTKVNLKIAESTDVGGSIKASSKDYSEDIAPDGANAKKVITAARGQTVVFTMTPAPGYRLKNIYVSGSDLNILDNVQNSSATPISLNDGRLAKGRNGVYQFIMTGITSQQSIHVEWEPVRKLKLTKETLGTGTGTFEFEIEVTKGVKWFDLITQEEKDAQYINSVSLQGGQSQEWDIPEGWTYTITEKTPPANWELFKSTNASGIIADEDVESVFTNRELYSITVAKNTVESKSGTFDFQMAIYKDYAENEHPTITGQHRDYINLNALNGWPGVTFEENGVTITKGGWYSFSLNNGDSVTIPQVPYGYTYEIMEETETGWELISVDKVASTEYTLRGPQKYRVEIEDLDLTTINVYTPKEIEVYYQSVTSGTTITREVIAVDDTQNDLLSSHFSTTDSIFASGKKAIPVSAGDATETFAANTPIGTVHVTLTDKDGTAHNGSAVARREGSTDPHIDIKNLYAITPEVLVNGNDIQQAGDHFQKENNSVRLRYDTHGLISGLNNNKYYNYNDVITLRYPNAASVDGYNYTLDVLITVSNVSLYLPTTTNADVNFKAAVFNYASGPAVYAKVLGAGTHWYGVTETVNISVPGAPEGSTFTFTASGIDGLGNPSIYGANSHGNFAESITVISGNVENVDYGSNTVSCVADAKNGVTFTATTSTQGTTAESMPLSLSTVPATATTTVISEPFIITAYEKVTNQVVTKVSDHYIVELEEGQQITIPDGKAYKIYKLDDNGGEELIRNSATYTGTIPYPANNTVSGPMDAGNTSVTFTNEEKNFGLIVKKEVPAGSAEDKNKTFNFTVAFKTAEGGAYSLTAIPTGVSGSNGTYTFTLKHDEQMEFQNLPYGVTYDVSETVPTGWLSDATYNSGTIGENCNAYRYDSTGDLYFPDGSGGFVNESGATVTLPSVAQSPEYYATSKKQIYQENGAWKYRDGSGEVAPGDLVNGGPAATVNFASQSQVSGDYIVHKSSNPEYAPDKIVGKAVHRALFRNTPTVKLTVEKEVTGKLGNKTKEFSFSVEFTYPDGTPLAGVTLGSYITDGDGKISFKLSHNESVTIPGLPYGCGYTVNETDYGEYTVTTEVRGDDKFGDSTGSGEDIEYGENKPSIHDDCLIASTTITYTNTLDPPVPTGVKDSNSPAVAGIATSLLLFAVLLLGRRSRRYD